MLGKKFNIKNFEKRDELIEAALTEFSEKSYDDASLNSILLRADMSKGSFYYHFKNKQELYLFLIGEVTNSKMDFMNREIVNFDTYFKERNIFELLRLYGSMGLKFAITHPLYYQFANKYIKEKNTKLKNIVKKHIEPVSDSFLEDLITKGLDKGELRDDFSVKFITRLFKFLFKDYEEVVFADVDKLELEEVMRVFDDYVNFIENGMGNKKRG